MDWIEPVKAIEPIGVSAEERILDRDVNGIAAFDDGHTLLAGVLGLTLKSDTVDGPSASSTAAGPER